MVATARRMAPGTCIATLMLSVGYACQPYMYAAAEPLTGGGVGSETCECEAFEDGDYSSCSLMKLPPAYPANLTIGSWPEPELDLDALADEKGFTYAEYMRGPGRSPQRALGAKFRNFRRTPLEMYWDDGTDPGMYSGQVPAMGRTATTTYDGHAFKFVDARSKELVTRLVMRSDTHMYIIDPLEDDYRTLNSPEYIKAKQEAAFLRNYYDTHGIPWLSVHDRPAPILNMWPADRIGQSHQVVTQHGFWRESVDGAEGKDFSVKNPKKGSSWASWGEGNEGKKLVKSEEPLAINLTVVSKNPEGPRVFIIENLLSEAECDHIIEHGEQVIAKSFVGQDGGFESRTRTSLNGWLTRTRTEVLDTVHARFADVLGIDNDLLRSGKNAEELQVVRYQKNQEYQPHHDFSDQGRPEQRFLTLLLYISPPEEGGYTSFPKANGGRGLRVKPPKGSGVLFYSMRPDGNGDDLSLHAGEPVRKGVKWICNLWVWDPKR